MARKLKHKFRKELYPKGEIPHKNKYSWKCIICGKLIKDEARRLPPDEDYKHICMKCAKRRNLV